MCVYLHETNEPQFLLQILTKIYLKQKKKHNKHKGKNIQKSRLLPKNLIIAFKTAPTSTRLSSLVSTTIFCLNGLENVIGVSSSPWDCSG